MEKKKISEFEIGNVIWIQIPYGIKEITDDEDGRRLIIGESIHPSPERLVLDARPDSLYEFSIPKKHDPNKLM